MTNGATANATPAASSATGIGCVGGATSFAAPHMSGAIAALLAPPPPLTPLATNGLLAATRLVETATPMQDPANAAGVGLLNIASALLPQYVWSLDFTSTTGRISDFGFLPGVGDVALRGQGRVIERAPTPGADPVPVVTLPAAASWLTTIPSAERLIVGLAASVEVRSAVSGTLVLARPSPSFRAAVSTRSTVLGGELILLGLPNGQVQLVRGGRLLPLTTVNSEGGGPFLDAVWATGQGIGDEVFAARTATAVEFFRVPTGIGSNCQAEATGCPVNIGGVLLREPAPDGTWLPVTPSDWTAVVEPGGPRVYVVNGTSSFFFGDRGSSLSPAFIAAGNYWEIEASPVSTASPKIYAADEANSAFATIQTGLLVATDSEVAGSRAYRTASALRVSPDGTYAYMASDHQIGTAPGQTSAVFVGGLVP